MQMHTDDELYQVDDVFLGPRGQTWPFRVRYRAYAIGGAVFGAIIAVEMWVGIVGLWPAVFGLLTAIWLTQRAMDHVDHERTIRSAATTLWHEITAPRRGRSGATRARMSLTSVRRTR
ncbi:hypothetical protein [Streptomyces harbinensis]|uniref:Uncharacterized protein n=1 Tax=Streptomyces harbinensis TaxID=1176198 RepID=A0A1I6WDC6_9ACTN|nr:hypothetical protein [Streptomyces harbinensis]SFT23995.1 hypothetical protein SAMN05444716_1225 [Streptomyces harbinensis]